MIRAALPTPTSDHGIAGPGLAHRGTAARQVVGLVARALAGLGVAGTLLLAAPSPAGAHNVLVDSSPAAGSVLQQGPARVRLDFDQPVDPHYAELTVTSPGGDHWESDRPTVDGNSVTAPIAPLGPAGPYQVAYRIVSADGHPVSGGVTFTLTTAGTGAPRPALTANASPAKATAVPPSGAAQDTPLWPWLVGGGVLLVGVAIAAARVARG
ncbi:copper resistance protein CopC [Solihabitans fulvus]|uniref:Copper resistance protein CopC n=1 Tax=Solihabitans fulvus TaxID=1892852 RepID=A0A5B2WN97_9PSEU|nr:copper resistance CopC family protein [Solihabitans fulvus]KAA2252250.1 copper resistance protein CopC [Solihabitans fulvus]